MTLQKAKERLGTSSRKARLMKDRTGAWAFSWVGGSMPRRVEEVLDSWTEGGRWWEGEAEAAFYRFHLSGPLVVEMTRDDDGQWWLIRIYD